MTLIYEDNIKVAQLDYLSFLLNLENESVDLTVTDPPYESLEKHRSVGTTTRLKKRWFPVIENSVLPVLCEQLYRVQKPNTHAFVFCDDETSDILKPMCIEAGFRVWKRLVWDRVVMGMGYHYRAQYEFILFLEKGTKPFDPTASSRTPGARQLHNKGIPDVLSFKSESRKKGSYPTEKPVPLLETLVTNSTSEGDLVIDPFVGSGNIALACRNTGRKFWGSDISADSLAHCRKVLGL
tara:strand:- start:63187 stop:63900 length:714 start_codon:yes stop_codon:yes gene_type:complete